MQVNVLLQYLILAIDLVRNGLLEMTKLSLILWEFLD